MVGLKAQCLATCLIFVMYFTGQVSGMSLSQLEEFRYLGVLFMSEGRMEREIDRRIGAVSGVISRVTCSRNELPPQGGWVQPKGCGVELSHPGAARSRAAAPLH